jgi:hypothetical protein
VSPFELAIYTYIKAHPGVTSIHVANTFPVDHPVYGRQRATSQAIASLRQRGLLVDCERCPTCRRAVTRGRRNIPLYTT